MIVKVGGSDEKECFVISARNVDCGCSLERTVAVLASTRSLFRAEVRKIYPYKPILFV